MRVHQILEKLDAQERRLEKAGFSADNANKVVIGDYSVETHAGEVIVPRSVGGPGIHIVIIPCGKFLKVDADGVLMREAAGTGELYEVEAPCGYSSLHIERVRVVAGLCDAPPEPPPLARPIEIKDKVEVAAHDAPRSGEVGFSGAASPVPTAPKLSDAEQAIVDADLAKIGRRPAFKSPSEIAKQLATEWGLG